MAYVARTLRAKHSRADLWILRASSVHRTRTFDGIDICGERVCAEIEAVLDRVQAAGGKITRLSMVGYSLGGLICRYALGVLETRNVLDSVECMVRTVNNILYNFPTKN